MMLFRGLIFLIGFGFAVSGGVSVIAYLNLTTMGRDFREYFKFILSRPECYLLLIGLVMITVALYAEDKKNSDA
ncbi:hypothetical protein [Lederbergia citrea]